MVNIQPVSPVHEVAAGMSANDTRSPQTPVINQHREETWCRMDGTDSNGHTQRRHYKEFNKSSIFEASSPDEEQQRPAKQKVIVKPEEEDPDKRVNMEHPQKRHYQERNRTTFDM